MARKTLIPRNCLSVTLDRWHEEGGYFVARTSEHTDLFTHAMLVERDGTISNYRPPEKLCHPLQALTGFEGGAVGKDPARLARPIKLGTAWIASLILFVGVTGWALDKLLFRLLDKIRREKK